MNYKFYLTQHSLEKIQELIKPYHKRYKANYFDRYMYIMDYVLRYSSYSVNSVPINSSELSKVLGTSHSDTSKLLQSLVLNGCLEMSKQYSVGNFSTHFSIPEYHEDCCEVIPTAKRALAYKIVKKRNEGSRYLKTSDAKLYLNYIKRISINDYNSVYSKVYELYITPMMESYKVKTQIKRQLTNLERIKNKDLFITRKDPLSRVCCNFSIMHHKLRSYLNVDGIPLSCIDLRNSQPLLAGMYIKHHLGNSFEELDNYISRCEVGKFYEDFMDDTITDRKEFKKQFFREVFFSKVTKRKTKLKKKFIDKYPQIYNIICEIKGGLDSKDYNQFAIGMQRFEANIIYDKINIPMLKDGYGCFNIYDSIVSHSQEVLEEAKRRIYYEFSKYGVKPTLNIETF